MCWANNRRSPRDKGNVRWKKLPQPLRDEPRAVQADARIRGGRGWSNEGTQNLPQNLTAMDRRRSRVTTLCPTERGLDRHFYRGFRAASSRALWLSAVAAAYCILENRSGARYSSANLAGVPDFSQPSVVPVLHCIKLSCATTALTDSQPTTNHVSRFPSTQSKARRNDASIERTPR